MKKIYVSGSDKCYDETRVAREAEGARQRKEREGFPKASGAKGWRDLALSAPPPIWSEKLGGASDGTPVGN